MVVSFPARSSCALFLLTLAAAWPLAGASLQLVQRDLQMMGTPAILATYAPTREAGQAALDAAVDAIKSTERQLSTERAHSALSTLNDAPVHVPRQAEPGMCELFADLYEWHRHTGGAFDPTVGALATAWQIDAGGKVPDADTLRAAQAVTGMQLLSFDRAACILTRTADVTVDPGSFGTGAALDAVARALDGRAWIADLGGQVAVGDTPPDGSPWVVDVPHPLDRTRPAMQVELRSGSLSTRGGSERVTYVGDIRIGQILDPRSGRPARFNGSVVVWHERALVADILSTALYVMGPEEGMRWADQHQLAAAFLIPTNYGVASVATRAFAMLEPDATTDR
jgi:thiamine biosynthesis lipoprotein